MHSNESVTDWIANLKADRSRAADNLYHRYVERLKRLARQRLNLRSRRVTDEDDIANIVLASAFEGIVQDRFHKLNDRDDLWQILLMLTDRKVTDHMRRQGTLKRGAGQVRGESALDHADDSAASGRGIEQITGREPTPEFAVVLAEEVQQRMGQLDNAELRQVALSKMRGQSNEEIARERSCTTRTIERKLALIRKIWQE
jgi:DNA-directed RNA polymerase specialized sigma24 family protein